MPRFVIQKHSKKDDPPHWDLMLEKGQILATYKVPVEPADWLDRPIDCIRLADHRPIYLDYQGTISGDRGCVQIAAQGCYHTIDMAENFWYVSLSGDTICGTLKLEQIREDQWQLIFQIDTE